MQRPLRSKNAARAFTLLEVAVVMAIIAVLAAMIVPAIAGAGASTISGTFQFPPNPTNNPNNQQ